METVGKFMAHVCEQFPKENLLYDFNRQKKYSYHQWGTDSEKLREMLYIRGFVPGDFVMMRFGNNYGFLAAYGGIARAEGVAAPVAIRLTKREIKKILNLIKPKWFLTDKTGYRDIEDIFLDSTVEYVGVFEENSWEWIRANPSLKARQNDPTLAHLRFTSGSLGEPKAVALTHQNMLYRVGHYQSHYGKEGDVFYLPIPFVFRPDRLIQALSVGGQVVIEESIYPTKIIRCWQEAGVTFAWLVPTIIGLLIQLDASEVPKNLPLRAISTGGAYLYRNWEERFETLFKVPVYQQYGLSEGCVAFENPVVKRPGSVGRPTFTVEAKICDPLGRRLKTGEIGELWYKGDNVMREYLDSPELTTAALKEGWLRTGDLGRFDDKGYLFIEGRIKDLIHVGGLKFSPREVEDYLLLHPHILEVSVVPVSHPTKGEVAKAYYVADEKIKPAELRNFCRNSLADYKTPREWEQVENLPKLSSGKVARRLVGEQ